MTDSCNQTAERDSDGSTSDDDSVSLLHDFNGCQRKDVAEDTETTLLAFDDDDDGDKEQNSTVELEINGFKQKICPWMWSGTDPRPDPGTSCCSQLEGTHPGTSWCPQSAAASHSANKKTNLHSRNGKGETRLHKASKRGDQAEVKALIQAGVSVNQEDYAGWTPLHEASSHGHEAAVEELLKAGANVHARSNISGISPLHDAVLSRNYQIVKLLLQYGSEPRDRNMVGLSALDMAEEENMTELLLSHTASAVVHEQNGEALARYRCPDYESQEHKQLSCQSTSILTSSESGDRDRSSDPGDVRLRNKHTFTDNLVHPGGISKVLEQVRKKQTEMLSWPLKEPKDKDRYHAALEEIQTVLIKVLVKQRLEKEDLAHKCRRVTESLRQRVLKHQLVSLASRQKNLVITIQKQLQLVKVFKTTKTKLSTRPCTSKPVTRASLLRSTLHCSTEDSTAPGPPTPPPTQGREAPTHADEPNMKVDSGQKSASQLEDTLQHVNLQMKGNNSLILTRSEENRRRLSELVRNGSVPPGSVLKLQLKGHCHVAHVQKKGSIRDSKGKSHQAPEHWLESIFGNFIPVSSAYAWDKVTFRDKPLSHYLLNTETDGNTALTTVDIHCCSSCSAEEDLTSVSANLRRLMRIRTIHLVGDDELLPNSLMELYWEKLLQKDCSESEDWGVAL